MKGNISSKPTISKTEHTQNTNTLRAISNRKYMIKKEFSRVL